MSAFAMQGGHNNNCMKTLSDGAKI